MKLLLVMHSKTVEKELWKGTTEERPLSKSGIYRAELFGKHLVSLYFHDIDYLFYSEYARSRGTAEILKKHLKPRSFICTPLLNPGWDSKAVLELITRLPVSAKRRRGPLAS